MPAKSKFAGIIRSARIEITIAFVVPVLMLGIACAIATGLPLAGGNVYPGAGIVLCLLFLSNTLNNFIDVDVDRRALEQGNRKSGMYHTPDISSSGLWDLLVCIGGIWLFSRWLVIETGIFVFAFIAFGLFMSLQYNLPPLKLAYRPFPELTMLLPSTIVAVAGLQYILVGYVTTLALFVSAAFGLFSASWFVFQSLIDYEVDKEAGKRTTPVYLGPVAAAAVGILYPVAGVVLLVVGDTTCDLPLSPQIWIGTMCSAGISILLVQRGSDSFKMWKLTMLVALIFGIGSAMVMFQGW